MTDRSTVRPAASAGHLYPADPVVLEQEISLLLESAPPLKTNAVVRGILVPHSRYSYAAGVAARAYRQILAHRYDTIYLIAVAQAAPFEFVSLFPGSALATPLGEIPVRRERVDALAAASPHIRLSMQGFEAAENALELQLPFLHWLKEAPRVVPVVVGRQTAALRDALIEAVDGLPRDEERLFIGVTNLSSLHPDGTARARDQNTMDFIADYAVEQLWDGVVRRICEMSAVTPAVVAMELARRHGADASRVLLYRNSGDMTGEREQVTGYLAAAFL